jgi:hypothetical protein
LPNRIDNLQRFQAIELRPTWPTHKERKAGARGAWSWVLMDFVWFRTFGHWWFESQAERLGFVNLLSVDVVLAE